MQRRWIIAALLMLAALALLPLRVALMAAGADARGLSARAVSGSVWSGQLAAAQWRGLGLGDVDARLQPLALATGTLRFQLSGNTLRGDVMMRRGGGGISAGNGRVDLAGNAVLPLRAVDLEAVDIGFRDGQCIAAAGRITVQPGGALARFGPMTGEPRCDGPFVLLDLASADGGERLALRIGADSGFRAHIDLVQVTEAERPALLAAGFQPTPQGLGLDLEGSL